MAKEFDSDVINLLAGMEEVKDDPGAWNDEVRVRDIYRFANAAGALTATRRRAIGALPDTPTVAAFQQGICS